MVKILLALVLVGVLSGCAPIPVKPCDPVIIKVPQIVKQDIPVVDRPNLNSHHLTPTASTDQALKTIQTDVILLIDYAKSLEGILNVLRSNNDLIIAK